MAKNINLVSGSLGCQTDFMKSKTKEPRTELLGTMVTPTVKGRVQEIADDKERSLSYIGGMLMLRGLAAFERDGSLKEPEFLGNQAVEVPLIEHRLGDEVTERRARSLSHKSSRGKKIANNANKH